MSARTLQFCETDRGAEPPGRWYDVAAAGLWKVERSEVGKIAASDGEAGKVRAVLGMRRRYAKGRLECVRARQDYGARWRLQDGQISAFPDAARPLDLAHEVGEIRRHLACNPHVLKRG